MRGLDVRRSRRKKKNQKTSDMAISTNPKNILRPWADVNPVTRQPSAMKRRRTPGRSIVVCGIDGRSSGRTFMPRSVAAIPTGRLT